MAKNKDREFIKAWHKALSDHLGCEEEGENPSLPDQDDDVNGAGTNLADEEGLGHTAGDRLGPIPGVGEVDKKKKKFDEGGARKKDATLALLASNLASKFNK